MKAKPKNIPKNLLKALNKHGLNYYIIDGELYIDGRQTLQVIKLCDKEKLPRHICS